MLLFGITGYTINHEYWLGATIPRTAEAEGRVPPELIAQQDNLRIVEHLRATFPIRGAMTSFADMDEEIAVSFKTPGESWEFSVMKATGQATGRHELYNFTAVINNLHRGRHTGEAWRWVIDISAALIVLACATGFVLWLALPRRRQLGIAFLALGTVATLGVLYLLVPGPDIARVPARGGMGAAAETGAP